MALAAGTIFTVQATATTGNVNGAGFNTGNANFPTDATATSATGNAPVISSATYTFVSGDVGSWIYIKSGTDWTPGFYQISSVAAGAATVNATIGAAVQLNASTNMYGANTVAGVATTASPTGGTYGVDRSQNDTAQSNVTNLASTAGTSVVTSASNPWTPVSVGNFIHITTQGTGSHFVVSWYEITAYTSAGQVTVDRDPTDGSNASNSTAYTGGAGRLNGLEDPFGEVLPAGAVVYIKNGSYVFSGAFSISSSAATATNPISMIGFNTLRGDTCTGSNRPIFTMGANSFSGAATWIFRNISFSSTSTSGMTGSANNKLLNCKMVNSSTTAGRVALTSTSNSAVYTYSCEIVCQNGIAISLGSGNLQRVLGCYIHDSSTGLSSTTGTTFAAACIFEANDVTSMTSANTTSSVIQNCTFYGREAKIAGTAIAITGASSTGNLIFNSIFYGFTTAINMTTLQPVDMMSVCDFFNNTTDATNYYKSTGSLAVNPTFVDASQITGTTATTSGSVLTQSGGVFTTVEDSVDYLHVLSGTGVTTGIYLITSHTTTTLTVNNALGTSSGGDVVYYVTTGHDFRIRQAGLKTTGTPSMAFTGNTGKSYIDVGAMQSQPPTLGATFS